MDRCRSLFAPLLTLLLLAGCEHRLTPSLQREIGIENDRVQAAERQIKQSEAALASNLASAPGLFGGAAAEVQAWKASLSAAEADLQASKSEGRELSRLAAQNPSERAIAQLLADERRLRKDALERAQSVDQASAKWLTYQRDPAAFVANMNREREAIRAIDLEPVTRAVHKAEQDWPAKKPVLESRLSSLIESRPAVIKTVDRPAQTPSVLIAQEDMLSRQAKSFSVQAQELQNASGQLYDSWDKILTDLDRSQLGGDTLYRERLKTVRTHLIDVPSKKTETDSSEHWTDVSEGAFNSVQNDIGMAIAHKDVGLFDSEAQNTPQPPGFSYVASPSVGSNQYGYWTHSGSASVWTFLPEYLILREMLWSRDYRPVMATEYNAYRAAQSRGTTYYGRETPTAAPRYGTHGTFTQSHYADSRYVQSGGFKGSAYASDRNSSGSSWVNRLRPEPHAQAESEGGKRFGRQPSSAPMGERFGRSPGPRPMGRSFGRRR